MERIDDTGSVRVLPSGLISRRDFAAFIGRDVKTLAQWAWLGRGPQPRKVGGRAYYDFVEVRAFAGADASSERVV